MTGNFFYFPLKSAEFSGKTSDMDMEEIGCYITLLNYLAQHNFIPLDKKRIRTICKGASQAAVNRALKFFYIDEKLGGYDNHEILKAKLHFYDLQAKRKKAGKTGADKRWIDWRIAKTKA